MQSGNIARFMYVEVDGEVHPRVIYQSNSQAVWRVMPMVAKGHMHHIGKGKIESGTQLPTEVNLALHAITPNKAPKKTYSFPLDFVKTEVGGGLLGMLHGNKMALHESWNEKVSVESFIGLKTGAPKQFMKKGVLVPNPPNPKDVKAPEDQGLLPDFSKPIKETQIEVDHYGKLKARIFGSKDNSLHYLYYEAEDGRVFIGGIEKVMNNPINKFGVRGECPDANNMDAPLLEYYEQIPEEYNPGFDAPSYKSKKYRSNWNYVRKLPLIKLYYTEQGKSIPGKV